MLGVLGIDLVITHAVDDRLEWHLLNWRDWMRSGEHVAKYPHTAAGCVGGGYTSDFEDMVASADRRCAAIMDALIGDLTPGQQCAIHHVYLRSVWRFRDLDAVLERAKTELRAGMSKRGLH